MMKKGQIGTEYLILIGFIVFVLVTVLGIAVYYSSNVGDQIKFDQLQNFANKIIFTSDDFQKIFSTEQPQLEKMLNKSKKWEVIYEDTSSKVWKKT